MYLNYLSDKKKINIIIFIIDDLNILDWNV